jgi:hypothetical protein
MQNRRLLLISRDDILRSTGEKQDRKLFRLLARFTRLGYHLLATAPQPEHWSSKHGGPDDALLGPESIRKRLADAGGVLDGVYYVPRSLLTQKRNREQSLQDILQRYSASPDQCHLLSSSKKFVQAAEGLSIHAVHLNKDHKLINELEALSTTAQITPA